LVLDATRFPIPAGFRLGATEEVRGDGNPVRVVHPDPGLQLTLVPAGAIPGGWYQLELQFPPEGLVDVVAKLVFAGDQVLWLRLPLLARNHGLAHLRLEDGLENLTLVITGSGRLGTPTLCRFERVGLGGQVAAGGAARRDIFAREGSVCCGQA